MPYIIKFMRSRETLFESKRFESFLVARTFAKQHRNKVQGAALMLIMETDETGEETTAREIVKL
jgi:hypothetical protein